MLKELFLCYRILKWHNKTFHKVSLQEQRNKHHEEINEFIESFEKYTKNKTRNNKISLDNEEVDVLISGLSLLRYPSFRSYVEDKMLINYKRTWTGNHHVKRKK